MKILFYAVLLALTAYFVFCTYQSARAMLVKRLKTKLRVAALLRVISAALVLVGVLLMLIVHVSDEKVSYSYLHGVISEQSSYGSIEPVLFALFIISATLILVSAAFDCAVHTDSSGRVRCITVSLITLLAVVLIGAAVIVRNYQGKLTDEYSPKFYRYDSPINSRSIVICERSLGSSGYGDIFQISGEKAEKIGSFKTDGGYRNEGKYKLTWTASNVTVTYDTDSKKQDSVTAKFVDM